ncbi:hypothetical protein AZH53_02480 [Methanomicrobiaceae archaeon CYW5]|uniref:hypothetical protein n=1 Tax=Methanovulcanius yangii TaxID=1789227 RepID=UPI0029C9C146|nr:hypothetical protein [Methanovulcanius yangii]MBT8507296.1 hypothetical protein [Methanovulcanius yangii]
MARGENLTDAIQYEKIDMLKNDLLSYIDRNSDKVNSNLPVFFAHVISALDNGFSTIDDATHDEFIDGIASAVMEKVSSGGDPEGIEKIISNAARCKRKSSSKASLRILAGISLLRSGSYKESLEYLGDYSRYDSRIGFYRAFCFYKLSSEEKNRVGGKDSQTGKDYEMAAREQLIELVKTKPPMYRVRQVDYMTTPETENAFWFMIKIALWWFPNEQWFISTGIQKAKKDGNDEKRMEMLNIATVRFYSDLNFLREAYHLKIEKKDAVGANGLVQQMMQQYPESIEPVYFGMKLALLANDTPSYTKYRNMAQEKGMPNYLIQLLDFAFFVMKGQETEAFAHYNEASRRFRSLKYYLSPLEYLARDIFSSDDTRAQQAKKVFMESVDLYALKIIQIK